MGQGVNWLSATDAAGRIARGDFSARILATSSDEFRRLVEAERLGLL